MLWFFLWKNQLAKNQYHASLATTSDNINNKINNVVMLKSALNYSIHKPQQAIWPLLIIHTSIMVFCSRNPKFWFLCVSLSSFWHTVLWCSCSLDVFALIQLLLIDRKHDWFSRFAFKNGLRLISLAWVARNTE